MRIACISLRVNETMVNLMSYGTKSMILWKNDLRLKSVGTIYNFQSEDFDFIISPIIGKALGAGFNLIFLSEIPTKKSTIDAKGVLYQAGFNKNF